MTLEKARFRKEEARINPGLAMFVWIAWQPSEVRAAFHALGVNWRIAVTIRVGMNQLLFRPASMTSTGTKQAGQTNSFFKCNMRHLVSFS